MKTKPILLAGMAAAILTAMSVSAILGLLWVVVFYVISNTATHIPFYSDLGQWNIVIGMGFIIAAFGFATKWE